MLKLLFHVGEDSYVVDYKNIKEIVPSISLLSLSRVPPTVAGYFIYRGAPVTVVDFCQVVASRPAKQAMHTRIILLQHAFIEADEPVLAGLIAERVIGMEEMEDSLFVECGYQVAQLPFLGKLFVSEKGSIQQLLVPEFFLYFEDYLFHGEQQEEASQ